MEALGESSRSYLSRPRVVKEQHRDKQLRGVEHCDNAGDRYPLETVMADVLGSRLRDMTATSPL